MQYLDPPCDERVVYNFHCYEPLKFTHQGAAWTSEIDPVQKMRFSESGTNEAYFEELFSTALAKAKLHGTSLYCGEYGVIENASPEDSLEWFRVINAVFRKYGISRAVWSYKEMNFGIADSQYDSIRDEVLKYL